MAGEHSFRGVDYESRAERNAGVIRTWIEGPPGSYPMPLTTYCLARDAEMAPDIVHPDIQETWPDADMSRAEYVEALTIIARDDLPRWEAAARKTEEWGLAFGEDPPAENESLATPTM